MKKNIIPWGLLTLSILIFILITLGGWVRNMGAGLSCPDWPLCFGKIIPHFDIKIFAEFFHRLIAGIVSLLFLFLVFKITLNKGWRALLGRLSLISAALLASQVVLGGLTVLKLLQTEIVTLHLATGTLYFGVVVLMTLRAYRFGKSPMMFSIAKDKKREVPSVAWKFGVITLALLYIQIILGGVVASHYAGLACPDFPKCLGEWWPGLEGVVGIQILHRLGALVNLFVMSYFGWTIIKTKIGKALLVALAVQLSLGIGNVLFRMPVWMSVAHLAVAELLFALVLIATYEIRHHKLH